MSEYTVVRIQSEYVQFLKKRNYNAAEVIRSVIGKHIENMKAEEVK